MAFLDDLKRYLERPEPAFEPDVAAHRKHLIHALARLELIGVSEAEVERAHAVFSHRFPQRTKVMSALILGSLGKGEPQQRVTDLLNVAIDRAVGLDTTTGSKSMDLEIDKIVREAEPFARSPWKVQVELDGSFVDQYALAVGAVRRAGPARVVTAIGKLVLDLPQRDAIRWLLAVEVTQAHGADDDFRLSRGSAAALLAEPAGESSYVDETESTFPGSWKSMERLSKLGLLSLYDTGLGTMRYRLLDESRPLLQEIASGNDTPFTLLARALLHDETDAVLGRVQPATLVHGEGSAAAIARHARMVAHEIRNALVPVQSALEALYRHAERQGASAIVDGSRTEIDGGVSRIFRFLKDISRIADLATAPSELFDVAPAVQAAIAAISADLGRAIPFEQTAPLPAVRGNRDRLVLAVINVLRNAAQARPGTDVTIRVSAGAHNGAEVFVAVDDDGPGVPPEHRASVFEPGFSLRPEGTGQGLALVREVVEIEMAGRAVCEESRLGGARFVIRLPVGTRRNG